MAAITTGTFRKVGMVLKKCVVDGHPVVKVRFQQMRMHEHFKVFLPTFKEKYCLYSNVDCDEGDMVVVSNMKYKLTHQVFAEVDELFFKLGDTVCPVTGKRCRGTNYVDEDNVKSIAGEKS